MDSEKQYIESLHRTFARSQADIETFNRIVDLRADDKSDILSGMDALAGSSGLSYALLALYRQQVDSGFVLGDPLETADKTEKQFFDERTNITFCFQWNPDREFRKNHDLLVSHGVIAENVDKSRLINPDPNGRACYLCKHNIEIQNPAEIPYGLTLSDERYYIAANFAYITNNHFTVMTAEHRPQRYDSNIPVAMLDLLDATDGNFRVIFNCLAGASIKWHEHLQATTEPFPVESIRISDSDITFSGDSLRVSNPYYYIPCWVIESSDRGLLCRATDIVVNSWQSIDQQNHTENLICMREESTYRMFIVLRDLRRLTTKSSGKKGALASFEVSGRLVLSANPKNPADSGEKQIFDNADLSSARSLLSEIAPDAGKANILAGKMAQTTF